MDTNRRLGQAVGEEKGDRELAGQVAQDCYGFLVPLLKELDRKLDVRLVRSLADGVLAIVRHRNRPLALLLSELGSLIATAKHAPAGTKRLANLIHSDGWKAKDVEDYILEQAARVVEGEARRVKEGRAICILDGSVLEKPESAKLEGLSPVRSAKARRIARPRPKMGKGYYYGKPGGPIVVPGLGWACVTVTGWASREERRPVALGAWHWYAKPQEEAAEAEKSEVVRQGRAEAAWKLLEDVTKAWGKQRLLHVWDREYSGAGWLSQALDMGLSFLVRWKKGNKLRPAEAPSIGDGQASPYRQDQDGVLSWKLTRMKNWGTRRLANPRDPANPITVGFAAREVRLLHRDDPLWLVVARIGKATKRRRGGSEPWRLLTNQPILTIEECWRIVEAYAARWAIEQGLRFGKSELGIESVRVRSWESRNKLLAIASLAYAFLLHLFGDGSSKFVQAILQWAHRTGRQARDTFRSLYLLRAALSHLWSKHTPSFQGVP